LHSKFYYVIIILAVKKRLILIIYNRNNDYLERGEIYAERVTSRI